MRQSDVTSPVYFDDLQVSHTHSSVVQKGAECLENVRWTFLTKSQVAGGSFGLSFNSYSRAAITDQNFKFNAGSELEAMTDWYSTPFRKYDPSLGRFHGVDKLASLYPGITPSHFGLNNPINYNDPTGLTTQPGDEENGGDGGGGSDTSDLVPQGPPTAANMFGYDIIARAERGHGGANEGITSARDAVLNNNPDYAASTGIPSFGLQGNVIVGGYSFEKYGLIYNKQSNKRQESAWGKWNRMKYRYRAKMISAYNKISFKALQKLSSQTYLKIDGVSDGMLDGVFDIELMSGDQIIYYGNEILDILGALNWQFWKDSKNQSNANDRQSPDNNNSYEKVFDTANSLNDLVDHTIETDSLYIIATDDMTMDGTEVGDTLLVLPNTYR